MPHDSPSRQLLFVCHPANAADETPCATKILSNLARRAYRRRRYRRRRRDAAQLLQTCARGRKFRRWDSRRAGARAGEPRFSVPHRGRSRGRRSGRGRIVFPMSSWLRDCRSLCGAAFRTTRCSTWQSAGNCMSRRCWSNRSRACSPIPARALRWSRTSSQIGCETRNVWLLNPDSTKFPWFRRQSAFRVRDRDGAVSRRSIERGPQRRRPADVE